MLEIIQEFIVIFIEISTLLLLWSNLAFKEKSNIKINIFITFIGTSITVFSSSIDIAYITILAYISTIYLVSYFYKISLIKAIFNFVVVAIFFGILQIITIKILTVMGIQYENSSLFNFTVSIILVLFVVLMCKYDLNSKIINIVKLNSNILFCFIINLGTYIIIIKLIWEYSKNLILNNLTVFSLISISVFIINMFLYWYIVRITEENKILEVQKQYEPILEDMIEEIRRKQHDFKNYLNAINGIIEVVDEEKLKSELKKYINNLNLSNKKLEDIIHIDNIAIRATVYSKLCEAERLNIKFIFNINNISVQNILNDYEITDILNNLINNAFEAVLNQDDKVVILNILDEENTTIIEVKNSGITIKPQDLGRIFKRGFSTKGENRGYGLYNIKKIVERSGGKIQLPVDDNYTTFKILFKQTFRGSRFSNKQKAI